MRDALRRSGLPLSPEQVMIQRAGAQELKVDVTRGGKTQTLIERRGAGYFGPGTPNEIAETLRKAL